MILENSKDAAKYVNNIKGWVSNGGMFFGDGEQAEKAARYKGCTHRDCKYCGEPAEKQYTACRRCRKIKALEIYEKRELVDWDGNTPLYSEEYDLFLMDYDELYDLANDATQPLMLRLCVPQELRQLCTSYWEDELHEDAELPDAVTQAIDALNNALIKTAPTSWVPGECRVEV